MVAKIKDICKEVLILRDIKSVEIGDIETNLYMLKEYVKTDASYLVVSVRLVRLLKALGYE